MHPSALAAADSEPGQALQIRSLERGLEILRAFRPGSATLSNGDIAERTGLSKSTVSRLTQTLVRAGMLQLEPAQRAYRLAPAVLSLAHAMRTGSQVLAVAAPAMRALAESARINVGLAAADRDEMVYLESIRYARRVALRNVVSGQRVPMELTSLGRAWLAAAGAGRRGALLALFRQRRGAQWPPVAAAIEAAIRNVEREGWCAASWQPEVVAVATPVHTAEATYVLNVSLSTDESFDQAVSRLVPLLMALADKVQRDLAAATALDMA